MTLLPPGTAGESVKVETVATISSEDKIHLWVQEENAKGRVCACGCGRPIQVRRRHYWRGVPKLRGDCRHKGMQAKRASITRAKYISGTELAKQLGIGRSTLNRWIKAGKLPKPTRSVSGMLLFDRESVGTTAS